MSSRDHSRRFVKHALLLTGVGVVGIAALVGTIVSCGGPESPGSEPADEQVLSALAAASVCDLELLEGVVRLGGRAPLAEDEPLFSPMYYAAIFDTGDVRALGSQLVTPFVFAKECLEQAKQNAAPGADRAPIFVRSQMQDLQFAIRDHRATGGVVFRVRETYSVNCNFEFSLNEGALGPIWFRLPKSGLGIARSADGLFRPVYR